MTKRQPAAAPEIARRDARLEPATFDAEALTVDVVWSTGASVRRRDWSGEYDEVLSMAPGAVDLGRLNAGAPVLNSHAAGDLRDVIGSVVPGTARVEGGQGLATLRLSPAAADADLVAKVAAGVIRNLSVGYRVDRVEVTPAREGRVPVHRVTRWTPMEVSLVPIPADPGAQVRSEPRMHSEEAAMSQPNANQNTVDDEIATRAERQRAATISDLASRTGLAEFGAEHVRNGTGVAEFRAALLDKLVEAERAQHPGGPQQQIGAPVFASPVDNRRDDARARAIESALLHRAAPDTFPLERGAESFIGVPLLEIARHSVEARGVRSAGMSKMQVAAEAMQVRGYHTSSDFSSILANVAGKSLRAGYEALPQTFRPLVRVTTVSDFKEVTRAQLGEAPTLEKVNEHGEFKRGTMAEAAERFRLSTFGKVVAITRQVIINDDLNAFTRVPQAFGVQAAQLESDLVWAQILSNPVMGDGVALFDAAHGNVGTPGPIAEAAVSDARLKMALQTGLDGETVLNITPTYLVVSKTRETEALKFLTTITPAKVDDAVPVELRRMQVISEPRIDVGIRRFGIAGDPSAYYFAATPGAGVDIIELAYLEGATGVYTETRAGFDVDGVEIKARLDVAAKAIDWRGLVKNAGTSGGGG